jgi:hypothetical protein
MKDVEEMVTEYCVHVRKMGIPLDRLFIGGLMLHPAVSAYVWKWEVGHAFNGHEIPREDFERKKILFSPDEPFTVLMDGRASSVRMRSTDEKIPRDCQWFQKEGYKTIAYSRGGEDGVVHKSEWLLRETNRFFHKSRPGTPTNATTHQRSSETSRKTQRLTESGDLNPGLN